ncbi:hypothetical protein BD769DRAFT_1384306 [Suillus cothurnatus]|nr:hypothetical protein BD769DRAFT_1384306 [Suillus cothurnatus]
MASAALTDTEVEISDLSFTTPETDKSFGAKGYDDKHPNKKWPRASATTEGKWTLIFNVMQAAMHAMYKKIFPNPSPTFPFCAMNIICGPLKHIWSSQFCNTPIPDDTNAQKPDVILTLDGMEYTLKDCWVTEDKKNHEVTIPKMVEGIPNFLTRLEREFHWHLLLTPCGEPLVLYSSKIELLRAFHDFVLAHSSMLASHVLHRDLSPNNFIIHDGQGYFIDFDHARIIAEGAVSVPSEGTGTRPYMSICLLREGIAKGTKIQHTASDDLESLFFIFVEFATTFNGPCGFMKDEALSNHTGVASSISNSSQRPEQPPPPPVGVTHAALAVLLKKWISQLPQDAPTEIMVPMASSSRLGHPPHNDIQSSADRHHFSPIPTVLETSFLCRAQKSTSETRGVTGAPRAPQEVSKTSKVVPRFQERTLPYKLLERIHDNLLDVARLHASGINALVTAVPVKSLADDVFDDAIREFEVERLAARDERHEGVEAGDV